jgi:hypothetical protein
MRNSNPDESPALEGQPDEVEDLLPGKDIETMEEGTEMLPRDHPVAAGADPAYAVTDREQLIPESVAARADREEPEVDEPGSATAVAADIAIDADGDEVAAEDLVDARTTGPEESALHITGD